MIDPGDEAPEILAALARAGLRAVKIVHTHAHFDHVMATGEVAAGTGADVLLHHDDRWLYDNAVMQTQMFGLARARPAIAPRARPPRSSCAATRRSRSDATRSAPSTRPDTRRGRSASTSRNPGRRRCCSRATRCSRGRSAAPICGAARCRTSQHSIRERLLTLPDATLVIPGHGAETTVAAEREDNPFVGRFAH